MPTYKYNGKKITSEKPLTDAELEEAFADETPPSSDDKEANLSDVATGAGLPSSMDEVGALVDDTYSNPLAMLPFGQTPKAIEQVKGIYEDSKARTGRYWDTLSDDPTIGRAAQLMMAPIPGLGNIMENSDKYFAEDDKHAGGRLVGNALAIAAPKVIEKAPMAGRMVGRAANSTPGRTLIGAGLGYGLAGKFGALEGGLAGYYGKSLPGRLGRIARMVAPMEEVAPAAEIKAPIDPRVAELKDLRLKNALAKEKGALPPNRESTINPGDVEELKRLRIQRQLASEREMLDENIPIDESDAIDPSNVEDIPKSKDPLGDVPEFPTTYKNVRLKKVPQPPNPYSRSDLPSTISDLETGTNLELGAAPETKMGVPVATHEELAAVQDLVNMGLSQEEAVKVVMGKATVPGNQGGIKLNPRAAGTNPRARGINPRALAEKRKGL